MRELGFQRHAFLDVTEKPGNTQVVIASTTSGAVIERGDSCRCSVPRYSPWKVLRNIRVV